MRSALLCLLLAAGCAQVPAPQPAPAESARAEDIAQLERVFWHCDYVATKRGVLATPVAACSQATEELKRLKFDGRMSALLAWWRANKAIEHRKLEQAELNNRVSHFIR